MSSAHKAKEEGEPPESSNLEEPSAEGPSSMKDTKPVPTGSVAGVVTTTRGPLPGALVSIGELKTTTNASGRFVLEKVATGSVKLTVLSPDAQFEGTSADVIVDENDVNDLNLYLHESSGTISGTVTDEGGNPLPKAKVWGTLATLEPVTVETNEKGHYEFAGAPAGEHYIRAKADGYMTEGVSVRVSGSKTSECDFALKAGAISLSGSVLGPRGEPVVADLYLMRKGVVVLRVHTSPSDGRYVFPDLIPGVYEIAMVSPGYSPQGWSGRLKKDGVADFKLTELPPQDPSTMNG
jgi:hypothetical protein